MGIQMSPDKLCKLKSLQSRCRLQSEAFVVWALVPYLVKCRRATNRATQPPAMLHFCYSVTVVHSVSATQTSHVTLLLQCHSSTQCQCYPDQQCFTQSQFFGVTCNSVKVPTILVHCAHCNPSPNSDQSQSRPQSVLSLFIF